MKIYDKYSEKLAQAVGNFKVGDGRKDSDIGPLIDYSGLKK